MDSALRDPSAGFTIVELVVLIVIVGIVGSIAAPRFLDMAQMDAAQAQRQVLGDLRFAQRLATASGCPVQIDFEATGYHLTQRTNCRTGAYTREVQHPESRLPPFRVTLPATLPLSSTVDPLIFDSLGRTTSIAGTTTDAQIDIGGRQLESIGETGLVRVP